MPSELTVPAIMFISDMLHHKTDNGCTHRTPT